MRLRCLGAKYWTSGPLAVTLYCFFALLISPAQEGKETASDVSFETYTLKERSWWAYQKPARPELPSVKNQDWLKTPVDAFILERLEKQGLAPAAPADRATLLRRVTFDLVGLPPTPEEVDAFIHDSSPEAYAKVVERLLASPRYGERWGRHWLDVVRYADTDGFEYDTLRPHVWRYRDYVIKSFNEDKPYDRFILEQLAGDELVPNEPDALVAVGFNRLAALRKNAGNQDEEMNRNEVLTERTNAVGAVFLGSTLACARCHNHLFDPLRQSDYYRLQAFFAPSVPKEIPLATPQEQAAWESKAKVVKDEIEQLKKSFAEMEKRWNQELRNAKLQQLSAEEKKVLDIPAEQRSPEQRSLAFAVEKKLASKGDDIGRRRLSELKVKKKEMMQTLEALEAKMPEPLPAIWSLTDDCQQIPEIHVLERGRPYSQRKTCWTSRSRRVPARECTGSGRWQRSYHGKTSCVGSLDSTSGQSADSPRHGQPPVALPFQSRNRRNAQRLWRTGSCSHSSGSARLVGD